MKVANKLVLIILSLAINSAFAHDGGKSDNGGYYKYMGDNFYMVDDFAPYTTYNRKNWKLWTNQGLDYQYEENQGFHRARFNINKIY